MPPLKTESNTSTFRRVVTGTSWELMSMSEQRTWSPGENTWNSELHYLLLLGRMGHSPPDWCVRPFLRRWHSLFACQPHQRPWKPLRQPTRSSLRWVSMILFRSIQQKSLKSLRLKCWPALMNDWWRQTRKIQPRSYHRSPRAGLSPTMANRSRSKFAMA